MQLGVKLASESRGARALVDEARTAQDHGFTFGLVSDHYFPWTREQGESPFVWAVLGALAEATDLDYITGVTCPTVRIHPAVIAQAATTTAALMPGRFRFGVGSGERLNEHVLGDRWPPTPIRQDMLEEAIDIIRALFTGEEVTHHGRHYTVENARLWSLPDELPEILVAVGGDRAFELADRIGDGMVTHQADPDQVAAFQDGDGSRSVVGEISVCWAADEATAVEQALRMWPNAALPGEMGQELAHPAHYEQAAQLVDEDAIAEAVVCGPDPDRHVEAIRPFLDAGFTHLSIHQVMPGAAGFWEFYRDEVIPRL